MCLKGRCIDMTLTPEQVLIINDESLSKSERFRKLYQTGMTIYQIAKAMNTHYPFVRSAIARTHTLPASTGPSKADLFRQDWDSGFDVSEISKRRSANYSHVYQVIQAYKAKKEREARSQGTPDTYLFLDSRVADLMTLPVEQRRYLDRCIAAYRQPVSAQEFTKLVFGRDNPVLAEPPWPGESFGWVTKEAYTTTLFQVVRDMLFRIEINEHMLAPGPEAMVDVDPFSDEWVAPTDAAAILGISMTAVHKAVDAGRLIAKAGKEGGIHRVISMNSIDALRSQSDS